MQTPSSNPETLEDILHHFLTLHGRWIEERQLLSRQNAELGKLVTRLSVQAEKLDESEVVLRKQISHSISESAHKMAEKTAEVFKKEAMKDVEEVARELNKVCRDTSESLRELRQAQRNSNVYLWMGLFVLPIVVSLLIFWWLSPKPLIPMTDQQFTTYQDGQTLESLWPKLTKKQKEFLNQLNDGKINNHGKRLDEMQDKNADNNNGDSNNTNAEYTGN